MEPDAQHPAKLDALNARILDILEREGRISNADLAARVGLSASACLRRVQELERTGIIKGYRAVLARERLGVGITAFVAVGLSRHDRESALAFERAMQAAPEVRECHNVTGAIEYLLRVEASSLEAYKDFHSNVLGTLPVVASITSHIALGTAKDLRG